MAPEREIGQLIHLMTIDRQFRENILDPATRGKALEEVQTGWKIYEQIPLTPEEVAGLLNVEETSSWGFSMACSDYRELIGKK